jgi:hypothetical protein
MYQLREVLFLVVWGTIASGDDYDDIVDWGKAHVYADFLAVRWRLSLRGTANLTEGNARRLSPSDLRTVLRPGFETPG